MFSPIWYFGGKGQFSATILKFLPPHSSYCEPFFGGGSVFFRKQKVEKEFINDLNSDVMFFYQTLRDYGNEFYQLAKYTEFSEDIFHHCVDTWRNEDGVKRAWKWWVMNRLAFGGVMSIVGRTPAFGFAKFKSNNNKPLHVNGFRSCVNSLPLISKRLENVEIYNDDALKIIEKVDREDCTNFLDPPYTMAERREGEYYFDADDKFQNNFVDFLLENKFKSSFVLSGYPNEIYKKLENNGWVRKDFNSKSGLVRIYKDKEDFEKQKEVIKRTESIWLCPKIAKFIIK